MKHKILSFSISFAIGLVFAIGIYFYQMATDEMDIIIAISNSAFVSGVIIGGIGLIVAISNEGVYDMLAFGFRNLIYLFTPKKLKSNRETYYEYAMRKKEERKNNNPWIITIVGAVFIAVSLLLLLIYYVNTQ